MKPIGLAHSVISNGEITPLNGDRLHQGDRIDYVYLQLLNRADLPAGHPLKASGLQASGFTARFIAKRDRTLANNAAGVINQTFTASSADTARLTLLPSATSSISFGSLRSLSYFWEVQLEAADYTYTLAEGTLTLDRDIALTLIIPVSVFSPTILIGSVI